MSVLNKKPFIQTLLESLNSEEKSALLNCINGTTSVRKYSLVQRDLSVSTPIESVQLETKTNIYNGYKIYKSDKITFLMYNIGQDINMYQIDWPYYEKELKGRIREGLSIDELRRYLETDGGVGETVTVGEIDSEEAAAGKVIVSNGEGGATWGDASAGLPEAEAEGRVLVGKADGDWEQKKAAPLADNLLGEPITNDAPYSSGPTGGSADIATGEEAYLQEVKGMSIVWNQLVHGDGTDVLPFTSTNVIIYYNSLANTFTLYNGNGYFGSFALGDKIFDLTLMFGGNDKIPFSLTSEDEYPANGTIPAQTVTAVQRFQRLFANIDLIHAPYDAGTIKNVKVTKLVETGRNLWDASTMDGENGTGLLLLAGYRYEIYCQSGRNVMISTDGGLNYSMTSFERKQRADGKYVYVFNWPTNCLIKSKNGQPIQYVGFIHSGNYCLTTGTIDNSFNATTDVDIPAYHKYEFNISGIDGLNGLTDSNGDIVLYDTKDYRRVGSLNLTDYANAMTWNDDEGAWIISKNDLPSNFNYSDIDEYYLTSKGYSVVYRYSNWETDELIGIGIGDNSLNSTTKPSGTLLYPLTEPVATGEPAFEPIALKSGDTWVVDDMGSEYFIQPANANCPVNQVAYYYPNLKDKLQNLEMPEVKAADFSNSAPALEGLKIGGNIYKCVTCGDKQNRNCVAIGRDSKAGNNSTNGEVAIGYYAKVNSDQGIAIGREATVGSSASESIAIGSGARVNIPGCVVFDSTAAGGRVVSLRTPHYLFFRWATNTTYAYNFDYYTSGHYLDEFITNKTLVENSGNYYIAYTSQTDYKTFTLLVNSSGQTDISAGFTGVHLIVKLSNNVVASLDLLPYDSDNSQAFTAYGIASDTPTFISGYLDAYGIVHLTAPSGVTISEVKYNLK